MSETALILAASAAVLVPLFAVRLAARMLSGGRDAAPAGAAADVAGVVALPPIIYLAFLIAAAVGEAVVPLPVATAYPAARYAAAALLIAAAVLIGIAAGGRFRAAGTNVSTSLPSTALVVDGIYAYTRNPFYVATTLIYAGVAVAAGSLWAIVLLIPLLWVINVGVIAREEAYLERKFGEPYRVYKARVRRWV